MSLRSILASSCCVATLALFSSPAAAQDVEPPPQPAPSHFGDAGVFALSLNHNLFVNQSDLFSGEEIQASVFLLPGFSAALAVGAQWLSASSTNGGSPDTTFILHLGPRFGYDVRFSRFVSFWPQLGFDYRRVDSSSTSSTTTFGTGTTGTTTTSTVTQTSNAVGLTVLAPVLIHPTRGFFVGAGPAFYADLSNSTSGGGSSTDNSKITSIGAVATIGGAF